MNERQKAIVDLVNRKGKVSFQELKETFASVSEMTIRRDLESLDQMRLLIRIHGGAKSFETVMERDDLFQRLMVTNTQAKETIARKALPLVKSGMTIYLDSGSTVTAFARVLPDEPYLIFTASLSVAIELTRLKKSEINVLGGRLNSQSFCMNGTRGLEWLKDVNLNLAIFGTTGYSQENGFTCGDSNEYELKRTIASRSTKNVVLMDASKVGTVSPFTFATLEDIDVVVADGLPHAVTQRFLEHDITIL